MNYSQEYCTHKNMLLFTLTISAFCVVALGLSTSDKSTFPVITCKRASPDYSACLESALKEAWPQFLAGLPEYDFPALEPISYKYGEVIFNSRDIRAKLIISNVTATGLSNARIFNVRTHFLDDVFRLEVDVQVPKSFVKGDSKFDGAISVFRMTDVGYFNVIVHDIICPWELTGHVVNDTWIVEHFRMYPVLGKIKVSYNTSSEQNREIVKVIVSFVNEYWPAIYRQALPFMAQTWEPWLVDYVNKFFSKVSFSKLFP